MGGIQQRRWRRGEERTRRNTETEIRAVTSAFRDILNGAEVSERKDFILKTWVKTGSKEDGGLNWKMRSFVVSCVDSLGQCCLACKASLACCLKYKPWIRNSGQQLAKYAI